MPPDPEPRASTSHPDPVEELLVQCLQVSSFDAEVERACAEHPEHATELRRRLMHLRRAGMSPSQPAYADVHQPTQLGPYRLVERLGGGGMGVVWRSIEEPFGREVAVKVVRAEHLYVGTARLRFLREIEAVSMLQHQGIVPVYSFGEHGDVPYYAMEMVAGRSLAELLASLQTTPAASLSPALLHQDGAPDWMDACCIVVAKVARALQHAHERNIVHRDVKPSNIMLADDGRVLLIDFGLAQVEGAETLTRGGVQPGSLSYMSPEQVRGEAVDHRTDIWSLGVTLYELLSLRPPFRGDSAGEMRQQILAAAPPPLWRVLPKVRWEIATIVATALAPEPVRRYQTARAFAEDLEAALQRRPIAARRPHAALRLRRFAQRHQVLATAAGLGLLLVTALPTALLLQARTANAAISQKAATAQATVSFLQGLFREVEPERARGAMMPARAILDRGVQRVRTELADQPAVRAALLETLSSVYLDLGLFREAELLLDELQPLRDAGFAPPGTELQQQQARLMAARGRDAEAEQLWREALAAMPPLGADQDAARVNATLRLGQSIWRQDRLDEAEALFVSTVAALRRQDNRKLLLDALLTQANFLNARRDPLRAAPVFAEVAQLADEVLPTDHPQRVPVAMGVADSARDCGELQRAEALLRDSLALATRLFDAQHPQLGALHEQLAVVLMESGRAGEAKAEIDRALDIFRAIHQAPHFVLARAASLRSSIDFDVGDLPACETDGRAALAMYEQLFPQGGLDFAMGLSNLCRLEVAFGRYQEAVAVGERSVAMARRLGYAGTQQLAMSLGHLAYAQALRAELPAAAANIDEALQLCADRPCSRTRAFVRTYAGEVRCFANLSAAAETLAKSALEDWRQLGDRGGEAWALFVQGWALEQQRQLDAAEPLLQTAVQLRRELLGSKHALVGIALSELGVVQAGRGQLDDAERTLAEAVAIRRASCSPNDLGLAIPMLNQAAVLNMLGRPAEAVPIALEIADLVEGRAAIGQREANGTVRILLLLARQFDEGDEHKVLLRQRAKRFAATMLAPDDPLQKYVPRDN